MTTVFITGTNRGLGLEFVKQYLDKGYKVIATCRDLNKAPQPHKNLTVHKLDVTDFKAIATLVKTIKEPIDILLNNAGILGNRSIGNKYPEFGILDTDEMLKVFTTNTISPLKIAEALAENIVKSKLKIIANISSRMGSIHDNNGGEFYAYRMSKTALNQGMKNLAVDVKERGIKVIVLHPGWVQTDMGTKDALVTPQESVGGLIKVIEDKAGSDVLPFVNYKGESLPW